MAMGRRLCDMDQICEEINKIYSFYAFVFSSRESISFYASFICEI